MHRKLHKHGRRSYLSVGTFGDSQSLLEREPLRSKDRGLFSYNIDVLLTALVVLLEVGGVLSCGTSFSVALQIHSYL